MSSSPPAGLVTGGLAQAPMRHVACPLCGKPNHCAPAHCGGFDTPCWCGDERFPATLLARVPAALRGTACICRSCLRSAQQAARPAPNNQPGAATAPQESDP